MSLEFQKNLKVVTINVDANGCYADLRNSNMDTELVTRLRARRVMMDKWEDANQTRTKTPKSSISLLKRPHQPDVVFKSPLSEELVNEIERLKQECDLKTNDLQTAHTKLIERNLGFEAMTVLVKYLTEELNAFSCPLLTEQLKNAKRQLTETREQLEELASLRNSLIQEAEKLEEHHKSQLFHLHVNYQMELQTHETQIQEDSKKQQEEVLHQQTQKLRSINLQHSNELCKLKKQHESELDNKDKSHANVLSRLDVHLNEKVSELNKIHEVQIEKLTKQFEDAKLCLLEKVNELRNECEELRCRETAYSVRCQQQSEMKVQHALLPYRYLEQEVDSLKAVMDLRNRELMQLRQLNLEMQKQVEELPVARETINKLQQKIENLEAIINIKVDYERELAGKHHVLLRKFDRETKAKKRLSMDNEELVWRLSQSEIGSSPDVFRMSSNQLPTQSRVSSAGSKDAHEPRQRPKSMVLLSPLHTPPPSSSNERPPPYRASQSTGGVKLRRPRMFGSADHSLVADMKLSEIKQSDV